MFWPSIWTREPKKPEPTEEEIAFQNLEREMGYKRATEIAPGVTLFTRDGEIMGNAIVIKRVGQTRDYRDNSKNLIPIWLIETDFGNQTKLDSNEINDLFKFGYERDYDQWWDDRLECIRQTQLPKEPT